MRAVSGGLPEPFQWDGDHVAAAFDGGRVLFSTRRGGISTGAYASLNLGMLTGDDPTAVEANRTRLAGRLGLEWSDFCYGRQVHGADVRHASEAPGPARPYASEDGQVVDRDDLAAIVFVADCLPVCLVAPGAVGALHGGWRGLAAGILERGVEALRAAGGRGPIHAALGPSARGCCYEVGEEVHARFAGVPGARGEGRTLDLAAVAVHALREAGVQEIHDVGLCTLCSDPALLFSHRRDGGVTGRQGAVAWRA
jgi:YfiH family protein